MEWDKPPPSLCDDCIHAYYLSGGDVSIGGMVYKQRYCNQPPEAEEGLPVGRGISTAGYKECKYYTQQKTSESKTKE